MCIFTLKNVIQSYIQQRTPVYSKYIFRFDCYNVDLLVDSKQEMCIKGGQSTSSLFTISNCVRQSDILSPRLFAVYVDDCQSS